MPLSVFICFMIVKSQTVFSEELAPNFMGRRRGAGGGGVVSVYSRGKNAQSIKF